MILIGSGCSAPSHIAIFQALIGCAVVFATLTSFAATATAACPPGWYQGTDKCHPPCGTNPQTDLPGCISRRVNCDPKKCETCAGHQGVYPGEKGGPTPGCANCGPHVVCIGCGKIPNCTPAAGQPGNILKDTCTPKKFGTPGCPYPPLAGWAGANVDRPGGDYLNFDLKGEYPSDCRDACARNAMCKAWTYVRPGVQGPKARCWLKSSVPPARPNNCCISDVMQRGDIKVN